MFKKIGLCLILASLAACGQTNGDKSVTASVHADPQTENKAVQFLQTQGYRANMTSNVGSLLKGMSIQIMSGSLQLTYILQDGSGNCSPITSTIQGDLSRTADGATFNFMNSDGTSASLRCLEAGCRSGLVTMNTSIGPAFMLVHMSGSMLVPWQASNPIFLNVNDLRTGSAICLQSGNLNGVQPVSPTNYNVYPTNNGVDPYYDGWF